MLNSKDNVRNHIITMINQTISDVDDDFKDELQIGDIYYGQLLDYNVSDNDDKSTDEIEAFKNIPDIDGITTDRQSYNGASQVIVNYEQKNYGEINSDDVIKPSNMVNMIDRIRCEHMLHNAMNKLSFDMDTNLSDDNVRALIKTLQNM